MQTGAESEIATQLRRERESTLTRIDGLRRAVDDVVASIDGIGNDDEHDPEGATIGFERAQLLALHDAARNQLRLIDDAIGRISNDTYGRCTECEKPIHPERLKALPTATTCVRCAQPGVRRLH